MFKVNLPAFYRACGVTPPNSENNADEAGVIEVKDGTDFSNLCRRSGIPKDAAVTFTFPDVCFLPAPAGPVPIPYPQAALDGINDELRKGGFPKVKIRDSSKASDFKAATGDEPEVAKGVVGSSLAGKPTFTAYSANVKVEGKPVARMTSVSTANTSFR